MRSPPHATIQTFSGASLDHIVTRNYGKGQHTKGIKSLPCIFPFSPLHYLLLLTSPCLICVVIFNMVLTRRTVVNVSVMVYITMYTARLCIQAPHCTFLIVSIM